MSNLFTELEQVRQQQRQQILLSRKTGGEKKESPSAQKVAHVSKPDYPERSEVRTEIRTNERPLYEKRRTRRYSFEFYEDQITQLKKLKYEAEMVGERVTLSDLVREALDGYLSERRNPQNSVPPNQ